MVSDEQVAAEQGPLDGVPGSAIVGPALWGGDEREEGLEAVGVEVALCGSFGLWPGPDAGPARTQ
jgi:hypothetical protein